jgi:Iron-containing redox enzyme
MAVEMHGVPDRPRLNGALRHSSGALIVHCHGVDHEVRADGVAPAVVARLLGRLDGETRIADAVSEEPSLSEDDARQLVASLDAAGLIDDVASIECRSALDVILDLEDLVDDLCAKTIFQNQFWRTCLSVSGPGDLPQRLAVGMVIENWHFLFRESYFDAPVLSYVPHTEARLIMNRFFGEEYGHDEILLKSLNAVGLTREDMRDSIPLPQTMALCNALAYWAHNDPLFFFTTLGLLEGQGLKKDSFIEACERAGLAEEFVEPLRIHSNINIGAGHGNLTREIFEHIPPLDHATVARLRSQTPLFVELYDGFYTGIWRYYTSDAPLLRRVSEL